jgi:hypothetical protein
MSISRITQKARYPGYTTCIIQEIPAFAKMTPSASFTNTKTRKDPAQQIIRGKFAGDF